MNDSIFINPEALEQTYLPRLLPYREEQHQYIAECIKPLFNGRNGTNLLIVGAPGIGKTACVRFILRRLLEETENIMPIYINCWKRDTSSKIINEIANALDIKLLEKIPTDELFDRIILRLNKYAGVVFAFDEIDKVKDFDFLYRIIEDVPHKAIFLITNVSEWVAKIDRRLTSRLILDNLEFKPYTFEETRGIIHERMKFAFIPDCWDYDAFETVVKRTFKSKDIRTGLFLMKIAGENAEKRGANKVEAEDIEKALKKIDTNRDIGSFV
jgi:cell division control protein 6